jgi:hypothetical protein
MDWADGALFIPGFHYHGQESDHADWSHVIVTLTQKPNILRCWQNTNTKLDSVAVCGTEIGYPSADWINDLAKIHLASSDFSNWPHCIYLTVYELDSTTKSDVTNSTTSAAIPNDDLVTGSVFETADDTRSVGDNTESKTTSASLKTTTTTTASTLSFGQAESDGFVWR